MQEGIITDEQQSSHCKVRDRRSRSLHKGKDIYWKNIGRLEHLQMIKKYEFFDLECVYNTFPKMHKQC